MTPVRPLSGIRPLYALAILTCVGGLTGAACDSDYVLEEQTEPVIPTPTPTDTPGYFTPPPPFETTPTEGFGPGETGAWRPSLRVEPPIADFGSLFQGCEDEVRLKVYNDGDVPMVITDVFLETETTRIDLTLYSDLSTLNPGDEGNIRIDGTAVDIGLEDGELWIAATEGNYPAAKVPVVGDITQGLGEGIDSYLQVPENEVDVLWVIDNSGSMSDDQKRLAANINSFIEGFGRLDIEYHMGVITTDMTSPEQSGRLQGEYRGGLHYIDWTMRDEGLDELTQTIVTLGRTSGSEQGLWAAETATKWPLNESWNEGFIRDNAFLSIIYLSDEEDQSPIERTGGLNSSEGYHLEHLAALKGGLENAVANAIVSFTEPQGYAQVATATGGFVYPIKSDYDEVLVDISWLSAGYQSVFPITEAIAEGGTIRVYVNDVEVIEGPETWTFDGERYAVAFFPEALPPEGSLVKLVYDVQLACELSGE